MTTVPQSDTESRKAHGFGWSALAVGALHVKTGNLTPGPFRPSAWEGERAS